MSNQIVAIYPRTKAGLKRDAYVGVIEESSSDRVLLRILGEHRRIKTGPNKGAMGSVYRTLMRDKIDEMVVVGRE